MFAVDNALRKYSIVSNTQFLSIVVFCIFNVALYILSNFLLISKLLFASSWTNFDCDNDLSKYIVNKHILEKEDGGDGVEYKYGIDNYAYSTAIHGALKHEIKLREQEIKGLKEEIESLKNEIKKTK